MSSSDTSLARLLTARGRGLAALTACMFLLLAIDRASGDEPMGSAGTVPQAAGEFLTLLVGQSEVVLHGLEPATIIIGDPAVVAASLAASDIVVLTGLEAGETNLIILDDGGAQIARMTVRTMARGDSVILQRGIAREVMRCHPLCLPLGMPGPAHGNSAALGRIEGPRGNGGTAESPGG